MSAASSAGSTSLKRITLMGLLVTFGIVFGDIGTSPLYVMKAIVRANPSLTPRLYTWGGFVHILDPHHTDIR